MFLKRDVIERSATWLALATVFGIPFLWLPPFYFSLILGFIAGWIAVFEWKHFVTPSLRWIWLLLPVYPLLPFALLIIMNQSVVYRPLVMLILVVAFAHDTGSYIAGKLFGKHKIAPHISPNKTWEGFIGGCFLALAGAVLVFMYYAVMPAWWLIVAVTFFISTVSFIGDLLESYLKRRAQIKDSGTLLPGHGGFLDRFDGVLFATYFCFAVRNVMAQLFGPYY